MSDLPRLIPDFKLLILALRDLLAFRLSGLVRLGDFITSTNLKYNFGVMPDISAIDELNRQSPKLTRLLLDGVSSKKGLFSGSFTYVFGDNEDTGSWSNCSLHVRSLVEITYNPTPFFGCLVQLYGIGILPSLQTIWEIIPFSFVADWFTNMSSRLRSIDLSLMSIFIGMNWIETSYRVTGKSAPVSIQDIGLDPITSELYNQYFRRELSLITPTLKEADYDFLGKNGSPNIGILGSLLFQLLK